MKIVTKSWVKIQFDNFANRVSSIFAKKTDIPTKTSQLSNDSKYIVSAFETQENMLKFLNGEIE